METPKRYHPLLVTLHWLVVLLVSLNLYLGLFILGQPGGGFEQSRTSVAIHMATGLTILSLIIVRFVVRLRSKKPAEAKSGSALLDVLAKLVHYGLYLMLLVITIVGLTFSLQTRRFQSTFLGQQPPFNRPSGAFPPSGSAPSGGGFPTPGFERPQGGFQRPDFPGGGRAGGAFLLRGIHKLSAYILLLLIGVHVAAALYHQFLRRDHLLGRMWYGAQ